MATNIAASQPPKCQPAAHANRDFAKPWPAKIAVTHSILKLEVSSFAGCWTTFTFIPIHIPFGRCDGGGGLGRYDGKIAKNPTSITG